MKKRKGKIFVIEGTDFSGKTTQYEKLLNKLKNDNIIFKASSFPNYESNSGKVIKDYLSGKFGENEEDIDIMASSLLYTVNRFEDLKTNEWYEHYLNGGIVIFSRYTSSNILHQSCKYSSIKEKKSYIEWLNHMENDVFRIPKPDKVFFLDLPLNFIVKRKEKRLKETNGLSSVGQTKDIHEDDIKHLNKAYETGKFVSKLLGWEEIKCISQNGREKTENEIHQEILKIIKNNI